MSKITIILGGGNSCQSIPLGRVGENIVTEIAFDFSAWAEEYGAGTVALVAQRNGDAQPYPVTLTVSDTVAVWSITDADVAITGMGKAQVSYIVGEAVKKSDIFQTVCHNSLTGTGEAPDPYEDWMDALERLTAQNSAYAQQASESATNAFQSAEDAREALEEFESVTVSATTLPEGSSATASYADGHIAFGIPKGNTGAQGERGEQGIQGIQGEQGVQGVTPDFEIGNVETLDAGSDATATITGTAEAPILNLGIPRGADGATPTIYGDASGSIASFDDGADGRPVQSLSITIEPVQSGSGTPSPDNVRPISGWTGAVVTRTGGNLFDGEVENGNINANGVNEGTNPLYLRVKNYIIAKPSTSVTISGANNDKYSQFYTLEYDENQNFISGTRTSRGVNTVTFTTNANTAYIRMFWYNGTTIDSTLADSCMVEFGSTATPYKPYNSTTYPITFPDTVYGGTLEVETGVLTVDRAMVDLGTLNWTASSGAWLTAVPEKANGSYNIISSAYTKATQPYVANMNNGEMVGSATNNYLWVKDTAYETASEFKAGVSGVQLCYELATPQTIQLTPTEVTTLLGDNNIYADTGDVDVTYVRDWNIVINKLLS